MRPMVLRGLLALLWMLAWCGPALGQQLNPRHPLAQGLEAFWYATHRPSVGGPTWFNVGAVVSQLTLTNMTTAGTSGWKTTGAGNWVVGLGFDGTDDRLVGASTSDFEYANQTFSVHVRWQSTTATTAYLIAKRDSGAASGWFIRINSGGTVTARISNATTGFAAERTTTSATAADGLLHDVVVRFVTDTAVGVNNDVSIFYDGVSEGTLTQGDPYVPCVCPLSLGATSAPSAFLTGTIYSAALWHGDKSAQVGAIRLLQPPAFHGLLGTPEALVVNILAAPTTPLKRRISIE